MLLTVSVMLIPPNSQSLLLRPHCITVPELRLVFLRAVGRSAEDVEDVDISEIVESVRDGCAGRLAGAVGDVARRDSPGRIVGGEAIMVEISLGGDLFLCLEPKKDRLVEALVNEGRGWNGIAFACEGGDAMAVDCSEV